MKRVFKLQGVPKNFDQLPFGRQIEYHQKIKAFKESALVVHVSQKRRTSSVALKEFKSLYKPTEFYCEFHDDTQCRDDVFPVWYKIVK